MRRFSANYIFTNNSDPIRNGIVEVDDNGVVVDIIDHNGNTEEYASTEFHNGIIVPGFVNAHCHTELSELKGSIKPETQLAGFVDQIRNFRIQATVVDDRPIIESIKEMQRLGTVAVADICNTTDSFFAKQESSLRFVNLIEVLGLDPEKAEFLFDRAIIIKDIANQSLNSKGYLTPHSVYTLSESLWNFLSPELLQSSIVSIHMAESKEELEFINNRSGNIAKNYLKWGLPIDSVPQGNHIDIVKRYIPSSANVLFVHNTFLKREEALELATHFPKAYFVLCPSSNLFIEKSLPDIPTLADLGLSIAIGTDSLASTPTLSILDQMIIILQNFPTITFQQTLTWATINGAKALGLEAEIGSIEIGKNPGLNLISPFDFELMKPKPNSKVRSLA